MRQVRFWFKSKIHSGSRLKQGGGCEYWVTMSGKLGQAGEKGIMAPRCIYHSLDNIPLQ